MTMENIGKFSWGNRESFVISLRMKSIRVPFEPFVSWLVGADNRTDDFQPVAHITRCGVPASLSARKNLSPNILMSNCGRFLSHALQHSCTVRRINPTDSKRQNPTLTGHSKKRIGRQLRRLARRRQQRVVNLHRLYTINQNHLCVARFLAHQLGRSILL